MGAEGSVIIFFPWGIDCVIRRDSGAGLRVGLLIDFLADCGYAVECVSMSPVGKEVESGRVLMRDCRLMSGFSHFILRLNERLSRRTGWLFPFALCLYLLPRYDPFFRHYCKQLIGDKEFVFLEYPFWAVAIRNTIEGGRQKLILTDYDQVWRTWSERGPLKGLARWMLRRLEIASLSRADRVALVSEADALEFHELGINTATVVNSVDTSREELDERLVGACQERLGIQYSVKNCLFVGGGWFPNVQAAEAICLHIAPKLGDFRFFILGLCSVTMRDVPHNVALFRDVDSQELAVFYENCEFALVPLMTGTGSSLKTIEALCMGKVIVSTSTGIRGLDFMSGVHGIVEDDLEQFAYQLSRLAQEDDQRAVMKRNARQLALSYDYRTTYKTYLEFMNGP